MNDLDVNSAKREIPSFAADDRWFVYAVARKIVRSPDDAEDVTQNALLLAYRHRDSFRGTARYRTWLYRIAATTALAHLRRERRLRARLVDDSDNDPVEVADPARSPEMTVALGEDHAQIVRAMEQLPPSYREVLYARVDATEPEVARKLGITVSNVKVRTHRARKQLRATLDRMETVAA
ncbi:MAG: RNA polymerase sigma factor [Kofleriaceae bacterium]